MSTELPLLNLEGGPAPGTEGVRFGFFTDSSVCIGCKACEVACKEWNQVPENFTDFTGNSMDNTGALGANAWRHVTFIEQTAATAKSVGMEWFEEEEREDFDLRWLMSSDVCKHCTEPGCLEVCPTGAIIFTEYRTVIVQDDICNGCGYCVIGCPFGVIERRPKGQPGGGGAFKCTLCYDRMRVGKQPACAQACPTDSIQFGPLDDLRDRARERVEQLHARGETRAHLYGDDPSDGVGGTGAFFLLLDDPEVYRLPPAPVTPTRNLSQIWGSAFAAALAVAGVVIGLVGTDRGPR